MNPMRSVLPSADLFRRSRLSSDTIKLCPVLNYVMSREWSRARQLPRPRRKKKKKKKQEKIEARFTLYTTSQLDTKNMTELIDEWMIEPV